MVEVHDESQAGLLLELVAPVLVELALRILGVFGSIESPTAARMILQGLRAFWRQEVRRQEVRRSCRV